jgi:hypothetical protein
MDYFQGVVAEYLRADRAMFVNPEHLIQLIAGQKMPTKGTSWIIDLLAVNFREQAVYLCEVTYSRTQAALIKRLLELAGNWQAVCEALRRDTHVPEGWPIRTWAFVPESLLPKFIPKLQSSQLSPKVTTLEMTEPWRFCTWDRHGEFEKPEIIPKQMR